METPSASADRAQETLRQLGDDENAVRYPSLPAWFFALQAAAVACVLLAQLLEPSDALKATFAVAVASAVAGGRYWLHRDRVSWVWVNLADMLPLLATIVGICIACWVLSEITGAPWVWILGAAAAGSVVLGTGHRYRQAFGHGA